MPPFMPAQMTCLGMLASDTWCCPASRPACLSPWVQQPAQGGGNQLTGACPQPAGVTGSGPPPLWTTHPDLIWGWQQLWSRCSPRLHHTNLQHTVQLRAIGAADHNQNTAVRQVHHVSPCVRQLCRISPTPAPRLADGGLTCRVPEQHTGDTTSKAAPAGCSVLQC